jgi:hypothetical protein
MRLLIVFMMFAVKFVFSDLTANDLNSISTLIMQSEQRMSNLIMQSEQRMSNLRMQSEQRMSNLIMEGFKSLHNFGRDRVGVLKDVSYKFGPIITIEGKEICSNFSATLHTVYLYGKLAMVTALRLPLSSLAMVTALFTKYSPVGSYVKFSPVHGLNEGIVSFVPGTKLAHTSPNLGKFAISKRNYIIAESRFRIV